MATATYDYPALKSAHARLSAEVEGLEAIGKAYGDSGTELIAGNNAPGVKETMDASMEQINGLTKIAREALEKTTEALNIARELHVAQGGEA